MEMNIVLWCQFRKGTFSVDGAKLSSSSFVEIDVLILRINEWQTSDYCYKLADLSVFTDFQLSRTIGPNNWILNNNQ